MLRAFQLSLLASLFLGLPMAKGAVLIPVAPIPGSTFMVVYDINDSNVIAGYYQSADGIQHGFFGPLNGAYETFDIGDSYTNPRSINNAGFITGIADQGRHSIQFERHPDGGIDIIAKRGKPIRDQIVQGINAKGVFVGNYSFPIRAYYGKNGAYRNEFTLPDGSSDPEPRGINDSGAVAGHSSGDGFLLKDGVETLIDYPDADAASTLLQDINNRGTIVGYWTDKDFTADHAFRFDAKSGAFVLIRIPHATTSAALGVNSAGLVTVGSDAGVFIYCPHSRKSGKCPEGGVEIADAAPVRAAARTAPRHRRAGQTSPTADRTPPWGRP